MDYINTNKKVKNNDKVFYINKIDPLNKYLDFGKYKIDLKQLKGGKLQLRSKNNYFIKGLENRRLTANMKNIIDKFISGQSIDYEDIDVLDDEEKNYLSQLAEKCEIDDRLKIPSPLLSKQQSEINKFNIMRGQIIAGNNSKELVKDFKILLLKLSNKKLIDKNEANEILVMLLQLGL